MNRMLCCLAASAVLGIAATAPAFAQDRSKAKTAAAKAEKPAAKPAEAPPVKCAVDPALMGTADQAEWEGPCEGGKATGKGVLQLLQAGQLQQRIEGEFAAGLPKGEVAITYANGDRYTGPSVAGRPEGRGTWRYANGDEATGAYAEGSFRGAVEFKSAQGDRFTGLLRDRLPDGAGVMTMANGDRIEAHFSRGVATPPYRVRFADGRRLFGQREQGQPAGMGVLHLPDGTIFEGIFGGNTVKGTRFLPTREVQSGEFLNGQLTGKGRIAYADGWTYTGPVAEGRPAGRGELARSRSDLAVGEIAPDRRVVGPAEREIPGEGRFAGPLGADYSPEGEGRWTTADGTSIQAHFKDGAADGKGEIRYVTGLVYRGELQADRPSGQGELAWPDGSAYRGQFAKGLPHGTGELTLPNKTVYRGAFLAGLPAGDGELAFADGSRYVGGMGSGFPDGAGEWHAPGKAVFKGTWRRGLREGPGRIQLPEAKEAVPLLLQGDMGATDEGPHFSLFKSKTEEIEGLVRDGFHAWALRYYQQRKAFFAEKRAEHASVLTRLTDGLGQIPGFAFEANRLLAGLLVANRALDAELAEAPGLAEVTKDMQAIAKRTGETELLAQSTLPGTMQAALADVGAQQLALVKKRIPAALASGELERAAALLAKLPAGTAPDEADRRALNAWLAENPESIAAKARPLQDLLKRYGGADLKGLAERWHAHFAEAVQDRDLARALAIWSGASTLGVKFAGAEETKQITTLVEWRVRADPDPAPLYALFEHVGAPAKKASPEGLTLAWLDTLTHHVERGDTTVAANLIARARAFGLDIAHPRVAPQIKAAIDTRLQLLDFASYVALIPELRALGVDLAPAYKGRVVLLRSGPAGGSKPFPFSIEAVDGITVDNADELAQDEALARQVLGQARYVGLIDVHARHVQREIVDRQARPSNFQSGVEVVPNPDYAAAERELFAIRIELATINASEAARKKQAEDIKTLTERTKALEAKLRSLPATVRQTLETAYQYTTLEFDVARVVPATSYLIDLEAGKFRRADFNAKQAQRFSTAVGIHAKDEKAKSPSRLDQVRQLDRTFFAAKLPEFLPAPNAEGLAPLRPLGGLPADLAEQRTARDKNLTQDLAKIGQDVDGKLSQVVATLHPDVRQRDDQAIAFIRVESDIPERNNRDIRKLPENLAAPAQPAKH
jgi:hypothetical protein